MKFLESRLFRRPRLLDLLHRIHLVEATSQTNEAELQALERHVRGAEVAMEIGSYQGVSAGRIVSAMSPGGRLYCVDPWPSANGKINPCYSIFDRHVRRLGIVDKLRVLRRFSSEVHDMVPDKIDFAFIDGDHSWSGVETDWTLVRQKLRVGGILCLHDSFVPPTEPWRQHDSIRFYKEVISVDDRFKEIERVHSLAVLRKVSPTLQTR